MVYGAVCAFHWGTQELHRIADSLTNHYYQEPAKQFAAERARQNIDHYDESMQRDRRGELQRERKEVHGVSFSRLLDGMLSIRKLTVEKEQPSHVRDQFFEQQLEEQIMGWRSNVET